eukprot:Gb_01033 [translate_table: standard]
MTKSSCTGALPWIIAQERVFSHFIARFDGLRCGDVEISKASMFFELPCQQGHKVLEGQSGIGPINCFDASKFPIRFGKQIHGFSSNGYIDPKNNRRLDDCLRYCLVSGKKALEDVDSSRRRNLEGGAPRYYHLGVALQISRWEDIPCNL